MTLPQPPKDTPAYRLEVALLGLQGAVGRFHARLGDTDFWTDPHSIHIPVTEALWWSISADEELEDQVGRGTYRTARDADVNGQVILGIRFIRHRCGHQRAIAPEDHSFRFNVPGRGFDDGEFGPSLRWAQVSDLPAASPDHQQANAALEPHYVKHLEGRPVQDAFAQAVAWFTEARRRWNV